MNSKLKITLSLLALLVILALWVGFSNLQAPELENQEETGQVVAKKDGIEVTKTNVAQNGGSKLPQGFPTDIPVELINITESYRAVYEKVATTQYTVSYTSKKSRDTLWTIYSDFMNSEGYTVDTRASSRSLGQISGTKGSDTLSAVISSHSGISLVQLSYLDR